MYHETPHNHNLEHYTPSPELASAAQELFSINDWLGPKTPGSIGLDWCHNPMKRYTDVALCSTTAPMHLAVTGFLGFVIKEQPLLALERFHPNPHTFAVSTKVRSMVLNAEALERQVVGAKTLHDLKRSGRDPRITPLGKVIRALSVDEFPQFMDGLMGYLSLVGPRAYSNNEWESQIMPNADTYPFDTFIQQLSTGVKYGVFSMYGIFGRGELPFLDRIWLDTQYMENASFWVDMSILARTIPAVISRQGAY